MQDKTITISPSLAADYSVISWSQRPLSCMAGEGAFYWRPTMRAKIYTLSEPSGAIRYVGKTIQTLKRRLYFHLCDTRRGIKNHRCNWIRLLLKKGLVPIIREIDEVEGDGCNREIGWISFFRRLGLDLVNGTDGGEGLLGCHPSAETRQRISEGHKGQISWSKGKTGVYSKETLIKNE